MQKANTTVNALTSTKKKILTSLVLKKNIIVFLFLSLLVNDCILMYLEITILCIYNFLILYGCLFEIFFFFFFFNTPAPATLKSQVRHWFKVQWSCLDGQQIYSLVGKGRFQRHQNARIWNVIPLCIMQSIWREHNVHSFEECEETTLELNIHCQGY